MQISRRQKNKMRGRPRKGGRARVGSPPGYLRSTVLGEKGTRESCPQLPIAAPRKPRKCLTARDLWDCDAKMMWVERLDPAEQMVVDERFLSSHVPTILRTITYHTPYSVFAE